MLSILTDRARQALVAAQRESRGQGHAYVGTEHVLLALLAEPSGEIAAVLNTVGVALDRVRLEIEALIPAGPNFVADAELPLTPRAKMAIEIAKEEARDANQKHVDVTHLFLGLLREPEGVAGKVLNNLGVDLTVAREEVLKIRRQQMRLVERAVRPVRASIVHKRKVRDELLSHLTGIYDEELERCGTPLSAMQAASERFGDPTELARELNASLPLGERIGYYINRNLVCRPHESASRYMLRFATGLTAFMAIFFCCIVLVFVFLKEGWGTTLILARPIVGTLPCFFVDAWLLGVLYIKLRDAMCGAPWARKSLTMAVVSSATIAIVSFTTAVAFNAVANLDAAHAARGLYLSLAIAATSAIVFPIVARVNGREQISDVIWASLDID
jgi:ATP-dependent Clp protease ATP-binding subunit ClpC